MSKDRLIIRINKFANNPENNYCIQILSNNKCIYHVDCKEVDIEDEAEIL